ncbi:MAG TPA: asparaginase [Stellaceae bacterium]|nr:asparaginase [Stellaceae bacterium]
MGESPVLVEVTRGGLVESRHRGAAAVVDAAGGVVLAWGDIEAPVFARSALKPLQALPLVTSGAADAQRLGARELALACASHHGEPAHVAAVAGWLARIGLGVGDLECGAHPPLDPAAARALVVRGAAPSAVHNNCSGKHAGFLATARHAGEPTRGYIAADHPVQRRVLAAVETMTGLDLARAPRGIDGCGIPVIGLPLAALARAMARMGAPQTLPGGYAAASRRLLDAMAAEPLMVSGSTGFATALLRAAGDRVRAKPGAEGVYAAALPRLGLGLALKIEDGAARASEVALAAILMRLGVLDEAAIAALAGRERPAVRNVAGAVVGEVRPAPALAAEKHSPS